LFFVLGLVSSVPSDWRQMIGWEDLLQNDLFLCRVERKTNLTDFKNAHMGIKPDTKAVISKKNTNICLNSPHLRIRSKNLS